MPSQPSSIGPKSMIRVRASADSSSPMTRSSGRWSLPAGATWASSPRATGMPAASQSESPTALAARGDERVAHRAADEDGVGELEEALDDADLVGHLRAAENRDERALGGAEDPRERRDLALEQQPGGGARDVVHDALGGRVRAVGGAEGVVDVGVGERGEARRQRGVVRRLAGLVADVLEHDDVPVGHVAEVRRERHRGRPAASRGARRQGAGTARDRGPSGARDVRRAAAGRRARAGPGSSGAPGGCACRH